MAKKTRYECVSCGYESAALYGRCPSCGTWNSFEEKVTESSKSGKTVPTEKRTAAKRLKEVEAATSDRIVTGIEEFDRVMGGGIVRDSITILTAKPGAGKSTLLLQVANELGKQGLKVLYASGEESESQIKKRADRILKGVASDIWIVSGNSMDNVLERIRETDADFIIIDSIQTFTLAEYAPSRAGTPTQTMECANAMLEVAKNGKKPRAVMFIGQMTKEDEIAGVRALEHLVDAVLLIEGESGEELRSLSTTKNRYGSTGEMGFFSMTEEGMLSIDNPSEYFITDRKSGTSPEGSALTVVREGTRPIILEIESLVSNSFTPYPTRVSESLRKEQLGTLVSIIEQRAKVRFYDKNVVVKTTGGMKLKEQASNLATIMSILSSAKGKPIHAETVFIADVGLTGELKRVPALESRIRELDRMGFRRVYVAEGNVKKVETKGLEVVQCSTLAEVVRRVFGE